MKGTIFVSFTLGSASQERMWIWLATALKKLEQEKLLQKATLEAIVPGDNKGPYRGAFAIDFTGDERCLAAIQAVRHVERAYFGKDTQPAFQASSAITAA